MILMKKEVLYDVFWVSIINVVGKYHIWRNEIF